MKFLLIPTLAMVCFLASHSASAQIACPQANDPGPPVVQSQHIFCGEVSGAPLRAKGFHSRPGGNNPNSITILPGTFIGNPAGAPAGIYTLNQFDITENGNTRTKAISTMFPDACSQAQVLSSVRNAAVGAGPNAQFHGLSGAGGANCQDANGNQFNIVGFMQNGQIRTAWPDY